MGQKFSGTGTGLTQEELDKETRSLSDYFDGRALSQAQKDVVYLRMKEVEQEKKQGLKRYYTSVDAKEATRILCVIVVNRKYNVVRAFSKEHERFIDIDEVLTDAESFHMGLKTLSIYREEDVVVLVDKTKKEVWEAIKALKEKGQAIVAEGKRTGNPAVVAFAGYYGGHGAQDGFNYAVFNELSSEEIKAREDEAENLSQASEAAQKEEESKELAPNQAPATADNNVHKLAYLNRI